MPIPLRAAQTIPLIFDVAHTNVAPATKTTFSSPVALDLSACDMLLAHRRVCTSYSFHGHVDPNALSARLSRALDTFVALTATPDREAKQLVIHPGGTIPLAVAESGESTERVLNMDGSSGVVLSAQYEQLGAPWCGPLFTVKLTHCADGGSVLGMAMSHLAADGETLWAIADMLANDAGEDAAWPAPRMPIQDERRRGAVLGMAKQWIANHPTIACPNDVVPTAPETAFASDYDAGFESEPSESEPSSPIRDKTGDGSVESVTPTEPSDVSHSMACSVFCTWCHQSRRRSQPVTTEARPNQTQLCVQACSQTYTSS